MKYEQIKFIYERVIKQVASTGNADFFRYVLGFCGEGLNLHPYLMEAVYSSNEEIVDVILGLDLSLGLDLTLDPQNTKYSPLDSACEKGSMEIIEKLIKHKFCFKENTIVCSIVWGNLPLVKALLGADPKLRNWEKDRDLKSETHHNLLLHAASNGHVEIIRYLLENHGGFGAGILGAVSRGHLEVVKLLVSNGYYSRVLDYKTFEIAIQNAIEGRHMEMAKYLINLIYTCKVAKAQSFKLVCDVGLIELVQAFIDNGVDENTYLNAVYDAIAKDNHVMIDFFIKNDSDAHPDARKRLLEYAIQRGWVSSEISFKGYRIPSLHLILTDDDKSQLQAFMTQDGSKEIVENLRLDDMVKNGWIQMLKNVFPLKLRTLREIDYLIRLADTWDGENKDLIIEYLVTERNRMREIRNWVFSDQISNVVMAGVGISMVCAVGYGYLCSYLM